MKKKSNKVKSVIRTNNRKHITVEGRILEERNVFGREEVLLKITKVIEPIWITKESVHK